MPSLRRVAITGTWLLAAGAGAVLGGVQDRSWLVLAATGVAGAVLQAVPVRRGVDEAARTAVGLVAGFPVRQLPADLPDFVGRLEALTSRHRPGVVGAADVRLVHGPGGVGKTSLVARAVHAQSRRFPDGHLYVDLQGYGPRPLAAGEVLDGWLRDLRLDATLVPDSLQERSRLFRSVLAGRRIAVVVDNASTHEQVLPLLVPGDPCITFVTSRHPLGNVPVTLRLPLDGLSQEDSTTLLCHVLGREGVNTDTAAVDAIARVCAGLPLAPEFAHGVRWVW